MPLGSNFLIFNKGFSYSLKSNFLFQRRRTYLCLKENFPILTLSRVAPSAVSKGWGGLIGPPQDSKGVGVVLVSNFSCNLRSDHDWHQAKGFTTFRCLEPLQLIVWKKASFLGVSEVRKGPPYESWANWTNFYFSCENGDILLSQKSCNLFHTTNEEKSQKISSRIRIPTSVYANTWQGGLIRPPPPPWIGLNQ